jgi:hypothetical protein
MESKFCAFQNSIEEPELEKQLNLFSWKFKKCSSDCFYCLGMRLNLHGMLVFFATALLFAQSDNVINIHPHPSIGSVLISDSLGSTDWAIKVAVCLLRYHVAPLVTLFAYPGRITSSRVAKSWRGGWVMIVSVEPRFRLFSRAWHGPDERCCWLFSWLNFVTAHLPLVWAVFWAAITYID